jgi:hypothetical protein
MLNLSGNSEQAFAQLNAINMNPVVWAEWNYNSLTKPYVVTSSDIGPYQSISNILNNPSSWKAYYNVIDPPPVGYNPPTGYSISNGGPNFETSSVKDAIALYTKSNLEYEKFSASFNLLSSGNYFKAVFYVKANMPNVVGTPVVITSSSITTSPVVGSKSISPRNVYYRIIPVSANGVRPLYSANGVDIKSISQNTSASISVTWPNVSGALAYDIYRGNGVSDPLPWLITVGKDRGNSTTYIDNLSVSANQYAPQNFENMKFYFGAAARLFSKGNYVESTKSFARYVSEETGTHASIDQSIYIDGVKYQKIELFFGSDESFDTVQFDIDFHGSYGYSSILISNFEVFPIDYWNFSNTEYFPIESIFNPHRPGEALLHPYLPQKDKTIRSEQHITLSKPTNLAFNAIDYVDTTIKPYSQIRNSVFNTYKYYISESAINSASRTKIRAQYHNYLDVNKIIIKANNGGVSSEGNINNMKNVSGSITLIGPNNSTLTTVPFAAGDYNSNGILTLYYDGTSWSTSRSDWTPPKLTDSGILQNVTSSVTGIIYNATTPKIITKNKKYSSQYDRSHMVEISLRLELDLSDITIGIKCDKTIDDADSVAGFPFGFINSNRGSVNIHNIPVYKNTFAHTIFDNISDSATFSDLLREGTKFTVGLTSPNLSFTESFIPFMTMFSDSWEFQGLDSLTVNLFDASETYLKAMEAPPYLGWNEDIFNTLTNVLNVSGFTDYDYDGLRSILRRKQKSIVAFWCDRKKTLFDVLKEFFVANQIGASFDEYGVLRFYDLDSYIYQFTNSSFTPNFIVSDIPQIFTKSDGSIINYEANLENDSYSAQMQKKIGKVTIDYKIPSRVFTPDSTHMKESPWGRLGITPRPVFTETNDTLLIKSWTSRSVLAKDRMMYIDPHLMAGDRTGNTIGDWSGYAFMQGELISWNGLEYNFTYTLPANVDLFTNIKSATITGASTTNYAITFTTDGHPFVTGQRVKFNGLPTTNHLDELNYTSSANNYYAIDSVASSSILTVIYENHSSSVTAGTASISNATIICDEITIPSSPKMSLNQEERDAQKDDIIASNPNIIGVELSPTGKIGGLKRGLRNTSIRDHKLYDDSPTTRLGNLDGWYTSSTSFYFSKINRKNGLRSFDSGVENSSISFLNNTCHFVVQKNNTASSNPEALAISPKISTDKKDAQYSTSASSFNEFSAVFQIPDSRKAVITESKNTIEVGMHFYIAGQSLMVGLRSQNESSKNKVYIAMSTYSDYVDVESKNNNIMEVPNVFDGRKHRICVTTDWINIIRVYIDEKFYCKINLDKKLVQKNASYWGFYVENLITHPSSNRYVNKTVYVDLHELYAVNYNTSPYNRSSTGLGDVVNYRHHWLNPAFLNNILKNSKYAEPNYYFWGDNLLTGVKIYDNAEFSTSPILEPTIRIDDSFGYTPESQDLGEALFGKATIKDLSISKIFTSPFNFSTIVVNNTQTGGATWIGSTKQINNSTISPFTLNANVLQLSDSHIFSKVINHSELSNSITLTTLWIQNTREAEELIRQVELMADSFSAQIDVSLFGNPLIQIGDICQFIYTPKKIGYDPENANARKVYCLVKSVGQDFSGGLKTNLSLRPLFKTNSTSLV